MIGQGNSSVTLAWLNTWIEGYLKYGVSREATESGELQDDGSGARRAGVRLCARPRLGTPHAVPQVDLSVPEESSVS